MMAAGCRILVVEDEPIIALAIEDLLLELGAQPTLAGHQDEALAYIGEATFDAAILDVNLHGARSYPIARLLGDRDIPFIFATGYGAAPHPEEFRTVPTVTKPYDIAAIQAAFARIGEPGASA